jgi:uncharacterized protein (TIGR03435 family)
VLGFIIYAYNVKFYQVSGAQALDHTQYDILAKAEGDRTPSTEEFRAMMQALLAERFKLKAHRETRDTPVYALVVGSKGPKLTEAPPEAEFGRRGAGKGRNIQMTLTKFTSDDLVDYINSNAGLDRPVVNQTGLTGAYMIELTYTPANRMGGASVADADAISIFEAVQEQLGLKLERRTAPWVMLVVDHIEKPTGN